MDSNGFEGGFGEIWSRESFRAARMAQCLTGHALLWFMNQHSETWPLSKGGPATYDNVRNKQKFLENWTS